MKVINKFQQGGQVEQPGQPPVEQPGTNPEPQSGNPEEQLMAIAQQIIEEFGPEGAAMLAQTIMQMLEQEAKPEQPVFARKGGVLTRKK